MDMAKNTEKDHAAVGARIRAFRKHLGYGQTEFAMMHNFSQSQYANWESGFRRIPVESAAILEDRYGLTLDFIFLGRLRTLPHKLAVALDDNPQDR